MHSSGPSVTSDSAVRLFPLSYTAVCPRSPYLVSTRDSWGLGSGPLTGTHERGVYCSRVSRASDYLGPSSAEFGGLRTPATRLTTHSEALPDRFHTSPCCADQVSYSIGLCMPSSVRRLPAQNDPLCRDSMLSVTKPMAEHSEAFLLLVDGHLVMVNGLF